MKKGLSVLLILAALFGFYGSAVNLNDVLACKDYWEEEGAKSTADMNKLEDGLNQLQDNEQAYLDGLDQVADGEDALADGEAALEEGKATLAQGEADYAAAPAKLAAGKKQLQENKASYVAGKAFKNVVDKSASGLSNKNAFKIIKKLLSAAGVSGVPSSYKDMKSTLDSLKALKAGVDNITDMDSEEAFKVAVGTQDAATQKQLAAAGVTSYAALKQAIAAAEAGITSLTELKGKVDLFTGKSADQLKEILVASSEDLAAAGITDYATLAAKEEALRNGKSQIDLIASMTSEMTEDEKKDFFVGQSEELKAAGITDYATLAAKESALTAGKAQVDKLAGMSESELKEFFVGQSEELKAAGITDYATLAAKESALTAGKATVDKLASDKDALKDYIVSNNSDLAAAGITSYSALEGTISALSEGKQKVDASADQVFSMAEADRKDYFVGQNSDLKAAGITTYAELEAAAEAGNETAKAAKASVDKLASDKDAFKDYIVSNNSELAAKGITSYSGLEGMISKLSAGKQQIDENADQIFSMSEADRKDYFVGQNSELKAAGITDYATLTATSTALTNGKAKVDKLASMSEDELKEFFVGQSEDLKAAGITDYATLEASAAALTAGKAKVDALAAMSEDELKDALVAQSEELAAAGITNYAALEATAAKLTGGKQTVDNTAAYLDNADGDKALGFVWTQLTDDQKTALQGLGVDGTKYAALDAAKTSLSNTLASLKALKSGTDAITGMNTAEAFKTAVGTQDAATQKQLKNSGITSYKALKKAIASLNTLSGFTKTLTSQKGKSKGTAYKNIVQALKNAGYGSMVSALPNTYAQLAALLGTYEDGVKTLAQGLADYEAAPAKLAEGRAQLEEGMQQLADGRAELAAGKAKLAEYEDGEQQVRDGLATLTGTEANGGLESIYDRLKGDDDFDNGDEHLELDEGLNAVTVGRGYQSDSGELITKEITNRAIGTAAGLGAGVLAVLAAILSFLKKNKGAGVSALLSAAAGGAAVAVGTGAGAEFSSIAGSVVGATPWVAFGILAGVALVHAIAHFAGNKVA